MIELYTWGTPNGRKASIMLEEVGLAYEVHTVNIGKGEQFKPDYLVLNPNGKIPTIVDREGPGGKPISVFESGAILIYLAEKTGKFLAAEPRARLQALEWLMFQMGGVGPMFGQAHHFLRQAPEQIPYAMERYAKEARRLYGVMERRLGSAAYFAGDYSIADIATFPWVSRHEWHRVDLGEFPNVQRWYQAIAARPAVERGMRVPVLS
jgi:GSH-dependent disulfide-bond oxidoreductase